MQSTDLPTQRANAAFTRNPWERQYREHKVVKRVLNIALLLTQTDRTFTTQPQRREMLIEHTTHTFSVPLKQSWRKDCKWIFCSLRAALNSWILKRNEEQWSLYYCSYYFHNSWLISHENDIFGNCDMRVCENRGPQKHVNHFIQYKHHGTTECQWSLLFQVILKMKYKCL